MRISLRDLPVLGSFLSIRRFVDISRVIAEASPAARADCLARHDANLVLLFMERTDAKVGTSLIFVPSGNFLDLELYHVLSLLLTSCKCSVAHSMCSALIFRYDCLLLFFFQLLRKFLWVSTSYFSPYTPDAHTHH
jgi:hypothetical protein